MSISWYAGVLSFATTEAYQFRSTFCVCLFLFIYLFNLIFFFILLFYSLRLWCSILMTTSLYTVHKCYNRGANEYYCHHFARTVTAQSCHVNYYFTTSSSLRRVCLNEPDSLESQQYILNSI